MQHLMDVLQSTWQLNMVHNTEIFMLLADKVDFNVVTPNVGYAPIHFAARYGYTEIFKCLVFFFFFLYMINIAYCNLKDFDYATDLLSDLSLGIETSVVDRLICYLYFNSPVILAQLQVLAGSAHGLIQ